MYLPTAVWHSLVLLTSILMESFPPCFITLSSALAERTMIGGVSSMVSILLMPKFSAANITAESSQNDGTRITDIMASN
jgi:hypothetical protein